MKSTTIINEYTINYFYLYLRLKQIEKRLILIIEKSDTNHWTTLFGWFLNLESRKLAPISLSSSYQRKG